MGVKLITDPTITAWALANSHKISKNVATRLKRTHRDAIERFIINCLFMMLM